MTAHAHIADLTPEERAGFVWPMTDTLRMDAAMVLWEAAIYAFSALGPQPLDDHRARVGSVQTRHDLMALVEPLHIGWHVHQIAAGHDLMAPFDWEFAPWFLFTCTDVDEATGITLKTGWLDLCRAARGHG